MGERPNRDRARSSEAPAGRLARVSRLTNLLRELEKTNPQLAADLGGEIASLSDRRAFGLNFERHVPESVELPGRPVRRGDKVRFLPARGSSESVDSALWRVVRVKKAGKKRVAELAPLVDDGERERVSRDVEDLVAVAEFRDPIYPGLVSTGRVERGGDKPFHAVINAENYHALEALLYTHEGAVDAIYIDPPYNTGAKDWKYNNDYVDGEDQYRHSKWLAMMERRLLLAKRLLNPESSVLVVTIDEKEYLRLGLLLQQVIPEGRSQMVSIAISPPGIRRDAAFRRSDEYAFYVFIGAAGPGPLPLGPEWQGSKSTTTSRLRWVSMIRSGTGAQRSDRPGMFYPVILDSHGAFVGVGDPLPLDQPRNAVAKVRGQTYVWPVREDGSEGRWQVGPQRALQLRRDGFLRVGTFDNERTAISYLKAGERRKVAEGVFGEVTRSERGHIEVAGSAGDTRRIPTTQWSLSAHSAADYGTRLLRSLLPERMFPFPKSLYAVEDTLSFIVMNKPDALVVDFFSGSGTTAHAVMRLNRRDGGRRRSILVTNNEVSVEEQEVLRSAGLRPGDPDWEVLGICEYITKPRLEAAVTGKSPEGTALKGDYKFTDEFPMAEGFEENVEFFKMTYEAPLTVAHNNAFERISPLLWLRAGASGRRIESVHKSGFDVAERYGVLFEIDRAESFLEAISEEPQLMLAFIVSDDELAFQSICGELPKRVEGIRLYSSYLNNFEINARSDQQ